MTKLAGTFLLVCSLWCGAAAAGEGFGLGVMAGDPTGLSLKFWTDRVSAVDVAFAWPDNAIYLHFDFVKHDSSIFSVRTGDLLFYYGVGLRVKLWDEVPARDDEFSVRIPLGLSYVSAREQFDIFLEIVPRVDVVPDSDFQLDAAIGIRLYFD